MASLMNLLLTIVPVIREVVSAFPGLKTSAILHKTVEVISLALLAANIISIGSIETLAAA